MKNSFVKKMTVEGCAFAGLAHWNKEMLQEKRGGNICCHK